VSLLRAVEVPRLPVSRLEPVIGAPRYAELTGTAGQLRPVLATATSASSTSAMCTCCGTPSCSAPCSAEHSAAGPRRELRGPRAQGPRN
jgi:hypothetical protein